MLNIIIYLPLLILSAQSFRQISLRGLRKDRVKVVSGNGTPYRLWDAQGIITLGVLGKPVGFILNIVGDLLRIQGNYSIYPPEETKRRLFDACSHVQPNGLKATVQQRLDILSLIEIMEASNPTRNPATSKLMEGFWKLVYTTAETGGNVGKFGPFVGDVYQDLNPSQYLIQNIADVKFPPIRGVLVADQLVNDKTSWKITFDKLEVSVFGVKFIKKKFPANIVRLWEITYLDRDLRILRARQPEKSRDESQIFLLVREEVA